MCQGCRKCNGCLNGPVRGNYDGLVVLSAVTKETLPNVGSMMASVSNVNRYTSSAEVSFNKLSHQALSNS